MNRPALHWVVRLPFWTMYGEVYLGSDGRQTPIRRRAQRFADRKSAVIAARSCRGRIVRIVRKTSERASLAGHAPADVLMGIFGFHRVDGMVWR